MVEDDNVGGGFPLSMNGPRTGANGDRMRLVLDRLIAQGVTNGPTQPDAKAVEVQLVLKSGYLTRGALSTTPEGSLRLLAAGATKDEHGRERAYLVEHFFEPSDVECVMVVHMVSDRPQATGSRIILPNGKG